MYENLRNKFISIIFSTMSIHFDPDFENVIRTKYRDEIRMNRDEIIRSFHERYKT